MLVAELVAYNRRGVAGPGDAAPAAAPEPNTAKATVTAVPISIRRMRATSGLHAINFID
jgi:hypothetical protein